MNGKNTDSGLKRRGRPPKVIPSSSVKSTISPMYSISDGTIKEPNMNINNIVLLKLYPSDISRLEQLRGNNSNCYGTNIQAFNDDNFTKNELQTAVQTISVIMPAVPDLNARKDLIINDGLKRQVQSLMTIYAETWPVYSPYACWTDCHVFNTTPVGIPHMVIGNEFHCYGNFCSYNCAMRYLCPEDEDDITMQCSSTDQFTNDDLADKKQLLELLCHIETGIPFFECIKKAPRRLVLKMFGGTQTIEEYRSNFQNHNNYHVFRSPMVPISYQMEECIDKNEGRTRPKGTSIASQKIERAYLNLLGKSSGTIHKLLNRTLNLPERGGNA